MPLDGLYKRLPGDPVAFTQPDHPRLPTILHELLKIERETRAAVLVKNGAKDFAEYRHLCGVIEGLDLAISLALQAKKKAEA